jgi:hypothetical protein
MRRGTLIALLVVLLLFVVLPTLLVFVNVHTGTTKRHPIQRPTTTTRR